MALLIIELVFFLMASPAVEAVWTDPEFQSSQESCIDCHSDKAAHEVRHEAVENGCDICHEATGEAHPEDGKQGFQLAEQTPDLCYYCHEEPETAHYGHQPVTDGTCLACHEVHGSSNPALLKLPDPDLCFSCHPMDGSKIIRHSAIDNGGCMICHLPHGAAFRSLLTERFPEGEYAPAGTENFGLCFLCHDTDLLDAEQTEWATNFRNGDLNLHHLHIRGDKGRSCILCHNLHASGQKFLIEDRIMFGDWEMKMNFTYHENGGSCLPGCHGKKPYTRLGNDIQ